jgi:hypothetical protein
MPVSPGLVTLAGPYTDGNQQFLLKMKRPYQGFLLVVTVVAGDSR